MNINYNLREYRRIRPGIGLGGPGSGFGVRPGFGFGRPGFGYGGVPFVAGVATGALLTPQAQPYPYYPYPAYPYPPYPYY